MDIVIAGGGTAGWISAYILEEFQPGKHNITVIESSDIGIIGAGEGSTGILFDLISGSFFGRNDREAVREFLEETDSTPKFGIYHKNWSINKGAGYFAPLDGSHTGNLSPDPLFSHALATFGPEKVYLSSYMGQSYENNKFPDAGFGFHFNAFKVGQYFKKRLKTRENFSIIDSVITKVNLNSSGEISELVLENGQTVAGDMFFDCTGFSRVLMSKLNNPWISYSENLITDRAMPFIVEYTEDSKKSSKPMTTAHALSSGWMWDIPLQTRRGCGYVYSSSFISEDDAQKEVENYLGQPIEPIRHLKFTPGRSNELWVKNCIASGLSAVFMEPLEATSIHTTIFQIADFSQNYLAVDKSRTVNDGNRKLFNKKFETFNDNVRDFLVLHYQGGRKDSEFWKHISTGVTRTPFVQEIIDRAKYRIPSYIQYEHKWGVDSASLWNWTLTGLGFVSKESAAEELRDFNKSESAASEYEGMVFYSRDLNLDQGPFSLDGFIKL